MESIMEKKKGIIKKMFSLFKKKIEDKKIEPGEKIETKEHRVVDSTDRATDKVTTFRTAGRTIGRVRTSEDDDSSFGLAEIGNIAMNGVVIVMGGTVMAIAGTASVGYHLVEWLIGSSDGF
jgi:hypothetical protein